MRSTDFEQRYKKVKNQIVKTCRFYKASRATDTLEELREDKKKLLLRLNGLKASKQIDNKSIRALVYNGDERLCEAAADESDLIGEQNYVAPKNKRKPLGQLTIAENEAQMRVENMFKAVIIHFVWVEMCIDKYI